MADDANVEVAARKGPYRGSGARSQRRDGRGRFKARRPRRGGPRSRGAGRRGPSHLARKPHRWLVRELVKLEHQVGRLEAEREGRLWSDPVRTERANMGGIRTLQQAQVAENVTALAEVLEDLAVRRVERRDREDVAAAVRQKTGRPFSKRQLDRKPYDTMFRDKDPSDVVGLHPADDAPRAYKLSLMPKRLLIYHIVRWRKLLDDLIASRRAALLAESVEEGWEPLKIDGRRAVIGSHRR